MGRRKIPPAYYDYRQLPEVVTSGEAAVYLNLSKPTIHKYAKAGRIPGQQFGRQWRFNRDDLRKVMEGRI